MRGSLFLDTGAFIALASADDDLHAVAVAFYHRLPAAARQVTTQAVLAETFAFLRYRLGGPAAFRWLEAVQRARRGAHLLCLYTDADDGSWAESLLRRFSDQSLSYVDALTLAVLERHAIEAVFAFDHHLGLTGRVLLPGPRTRPAVP